MPKGLVRAFIPWVVFFLFAESGNAGLKVGITASLIIFIVLSKDSAKKFYTLDIGSALFFGIYFILVVIFDSYWAAAYATLIGNATLAAIAIASLIRKKPFTLEYAQEFTTEERGLSQLFYKMHLYLSYVWTACFFISTLFVAIMLTSNKITFWSGPFITILLFAIGLGITIWFPDWYEDRELTSNGVKNIRGLSRIKRVQLKEAILSYRTIGDGEPILMLPGFSLSMYSWGANFIQELAKNFQVILVDYPLVGSSVIFSGDFTQESLAALLTQFFDHLKIKNCTVLGFSFGGFIAQELAINYPQYVKRMILIESDPGGLKAVQADSKILEVFKDPLSNPSEQAQRFLPVFFPENILAGMEPKVKPILITAAIEGKVTRGAIAAINRIETKWYGSNANYEHLQKIECPTLVITAENDTIVPPHNSRVLASRLKNSALINIPNAGHGLLYQCPEVVVSQIILFIKSSKS